MLGRWSDDRIAGSGGALRGSGLALAGKLGGIFVTVIWGVALAFYVVRIVIGVVTSS
jgi:hypothetical protein